MKLIDFNGLQYFYKKIKQMFATLNSNGKVPYDQLPDNVKKVKYIKKERRNFFHKVIPISFFVDDGGNYNPQINGKFEDWYCSWFPVFKIKQGKKFRLFICRYYDNPSYNNNITNYIEVGLEDLTYWHPNENKRVNLIEKSGDALICNNRDLLPNNINYPCVNICFRSMTFNEDINKSNILSDANTVHIMRTSYEKSTDTYYIYALFNNNYHPTPWNKNLKWIGDRIECILPTSMKDVNARLEFIHDSFYFNSKHTDEIVRYYKSFKKRQDFKSIKLVKRRLSKKLVKLKGKTIIVSTNYHHYNKQPTKFNLVYLQNDGNVMIKKVE